MNFSNQNEFKASPVWVDSLKERLGSPLLTMEDQEEGLGSLFLTTKGVLRTNFFTMEGDRGHLSSPRRINWDHFSTPWRTDWGQLSSSWKVHWGCLSSPQRMIEATFPHQSEDWGCLLSPTIAGYQGDLCEDDVDECASHPCQNEGICINLVNSFRCECMERYHGVFCQKLIQSCKSGPCINGK